MTSLLLILSGGFVVLSASSLAVGHLAHTRWLAAAKELGLTYDPGGWLFGKRAMRGWLQGLEVSAKEVSPGPDDDDTRGVVEVRLPQGLASEVKVRPSGSYSSWKDLVRGGAVEIGDEDFESRARLQGDPSALLALLDPQLRAELSERLGAGFALDEGVVTGSVTGFLPSAELLVQTVKECVRLARRLDAQPGDIPRLLLDRVKEDPAEGVRLRSLQLLAQRGPSLQLRQAVTAALRDTSPPVQQLATELAGGGTSTAQGG